MELDERQLETLERTIRSLSSEIHDLQLKVQQLEYYKADDKHSHPEYERRGELYTDRNYRTKEV